MRNIRLTSAVPDGLSVDSLDIGESNSNFRLVLLTYSIEGVGDSVECDWRQGIRTHTPLVFASFIGCPRRKLIPKIPYGSGPNFTTYENENNF